MKESTLTKFWQNHRDHLIAMIFVTIVMISLGWILSAFLGATLFIALLVLAPLSVSWVFIIRQASMGRYLNARSIYFGFRNFSRSLLTGIYLYWPAVAAFFIAYLLLSLPASLFLFRGITLSDAMLQEIYQFTTLSQLVEWLRSLSINITEFTIVMIAILVIALLVSIYVYGRRQFSIVASMDVVKAPLTLIESVVRTYTKKHQLLIFIQNAVFWVPAAVLFVIFVALSPIPLGASSDAIYILNGIVALIIITPTKIAHTFHLVDWYKEHIFDELKKRTETPDNLPPNP